jgi:hypothetical protein
LLGGLALKIVKHERRSIVVRQTVDYFPYASVHLVYNDSFINGEVGVRQIVRFAYLNDTKAVLGFSKIVGGNAGGDGERPWFSLVPKLGTRYALSCG